MLLGQLGAHTEAGAQPRPHYESPDLEGIRFKRSPNRSRARLNVLSVRLYMFFEREPYWSSWGRPRVGDTLARLGLSPLCIFRSSKEALRMPRCLCLGTRVQKTLGLWSSARNWLPSFRIARMHAEPLISRSSISLARVDPSRLIHSGSTASLE